MRGRSEPSSVSSAPTTTDCEPVSLDVLVLVAFGETDFTPQAGTDPPHELEPWLDGYEFADSLVVPGANAPLVYTGDGLGLTATGMGKAEAAATTTALCTSPAVDLDGALVLSVGIAGGPPTECTLGSVVLSDRLVDWDRKYRWAERDGEADRAIDLLVYRPHDYVFRLDDDLVATALDLAAAVELTDDAAARAAREPYPHDAARAGPSVQRGTQVCGDEFWHGPTCAGWAQWLVDTYDAGTYTVTAMEEFGTATALARFGRLDRYLSVRGVANFDRPRPGQSVEDSLREETGGFAMDLGLENAFRVASRIADDFLDRG